MISPLRGRFRRATAIFLTAAMVGSGFAAFPAPASAATITVCPTGCPYSDLLVAVSHANAGDTVVVGSGTYTLTGTLDISRNLTIAGRDSQTGTAADVVIDGSGNGSQSVVRIESGVSAILSGVTITGGHPPDGASGISGGTPTPTPSSTPTSTPTLAVESKTSGGASGTNGGNGGDGGGIYNLGTLIARDIIARGNTTGTGGNATGGPPSTAGSGGNGGGIYNGGTLALIRSTVSGNTTGSGGSSFYGSTFAGSGGNGAGIFNGGTLTMTASTISANVTGAGGPAGEVYYEYGTAGNGGDGGGVDNNGSLTVLSSTIGGNAAGNGGGTAHSGPAYCGNGGSGAGIANLKTLQIADSTLANNVAGNGGVGIDDHDGTYCVIYIGHAFGGSGGGIANWGSAAAINSTLSGNVAGQGGTDGTVVGPPGVGGGIATTSGVSLGLVNSLVAGNLDPTSEYDLAGTYGDPETGKTGLTGSDSYNLVGLSFGGQSYTLPFILSSAGLASNGGPTQTIALRSGGPAGNPAIGTANEAVCQGPAIKGKDQRGAVRPTTSCDLGAYEDPGNAVAP